MISKQNQPLSIGLQTNKEKSKHNAYKRHASKLNGKKYILFERSKRKSIYDEKMMSINLRCH